MQGIIFPLEGRIETTYSGYNQLSRFYHFCLKHPTGSHFYIDFKEVEWFDGNLCALLWAIVYHLNKTHGHTFSTDPQIIKEKFDVLYRNGFLKSDEEIIDDRKSTIPIESFAIDEKERFCDYVKNNLITHRGMPDNLSEPLKEQINDDLFEVFCNTHEHANTKDPFFVGGQYYPKKGYLKFTMVDLGEGFLPRIRQATKGAITTQLAAVLWALEGNTTRRFFENCPGGLGIKNMAKYCFENKGELQIISYNGFWSTELEGSIFEGGRELPNPFIGTTINLFFKKE